MLKGFGFLAVLAFALINGARLMRRLESAHPDVWNALGRPDFRLSTGFGPRLALVRFVWSLKWRTFGDAALNTHCLAAMLAEPLLVVAGARLVFG
ncbi:MAG: hypothetical protein QMD73_04985 [Rhodocyclaceae bacterium]|mgnify:CR=1 FL=1|uniref:hypothetical protein n=1 Tax=Sulfuricystis thermophila TaxID=2496847 RepID=UPI001035A62C|nr:hypothetical protein [Sulfuricystis thermophila]MDI6749510.1 hypothetical protein [Rhodocyclaceae bacterium]